MRPVDDDALKHFKRFVSLANIDAQRKVHQSVKWLTAAIPILRLIHSSY